MTTKKNPNKHYSATVTGNGAEVLAQIHSVYNANPSAIASSLLQAVVNVGPDLYADYMREVKRIELELVARRSAVSDTPERLSTVSPDAIGQALSRKSVARIMELKKPAALNTLPACLFNRDGRLLWRSTFCTGGTRCPEKEKQVLEFRYQEFIHPRDLPLLLRWLREDADTLCTIRVMLPSTGQCGRATYTKIPCGEDWLVLFRFDPYPGGCDRSLCSK